jgi:hypothetical protein
LPFPTPRKAGEPVSDLKADLRKAGLLPPLPVTKRCRHCGAWKVREDFRPNKAVSDGLSSWCKDCHNAASRASKAKRKAEDPEWRQAEYARARQREAPR